MRRTLLAVSALALLAACSPKADKASDSVAATPPADAPAVAAADAPAPNAAALPPTLATFVPVAAASDMYEIEAGKMAQAKAKSPDVKAFGKMMQTDHTKSTAALKAAIAASGQPAPTPGALPADKQALLDALKAASPADFDKTYLDQQETAHTDTLAVMKAYAEGGDVAQVKDFASKTAPVVQMHLDKIKSLKMAMTK